MKLLSNFFCQVFLVATSLWFFSSAINPFIYGVMNNTFRAEYKKMFSFISVSFPTRTSPDVASAEQVPPSSGGSV